MERRLLIVEDDCLIAEAAADYFTSKGWLVKTEESGIRAIRRLERESFHLILLDVMLPFMQKNPAEQRRACDFYHSQSYGGG